MRELNQPIDPTHSLKYSTAAATSYRSALYLARSAHRWQIGADDLISGFLFHLATDEVPLLEAEPLNGSIT